MTNRVEVLLVGPRVSQLKPHFEARGYVAEACATAAPALDRVRLRAWDLIVLEIDLGGQTSVEFAAAVRSLAPHTAMLLLDDATRAWQIVQSLEAGVTHFLSTPPDERRLFADAGRLVLLARAMSGQLELTQQQLMADARRQVEQANLQAENAVMQAQLMRQQGERAEEQRAALEQEIHKLRAQLLATQEDASTKSTRLTDLEAARQSSAHRDAELEERNATLASQLAKASADASASAQARSSLEEKCQILEAEKATLEDRAVDLELQVDELHLKLSFLEEEQEAARAKAQQVEAQYRKDRVRLIEEKQLAVQELSECKTTLASFERRGAASVGQAHKQE